MGEPVIEVENLSFRYDKRARQEILSAITFTVKKGEWIAIVGPNGSGKSTLANLLCGLLYPDEGTIRINGNTSPKKPFGRFGKNRCRFPESRSSIYRHNRSR